MLPTPLSTKAQPNPRSKASPSAQPVYPPNTVPTKMPSFTTTKVSGAKAPDAMVIWRRCTLAGFAVYSRAESTQLSPP